MHDKRRIKQEGSFYKQMGLKFQEGKVKCYIWSIASTPKLGPLRKQITTPGKFEIWYWRRMEKSVGPIV